MLTIWLFILVFFLFVIASILEAKADSLTDAALDRRMDMKDAQYVEMNKQAQIMWEKAQELKGMYQFISKTEHDS